jgi:hypothetical protein
MYYKVFLLLFPCAQQDYHTESLHILAYTMAGTTFMEMAKYSLCTYVPTFQRNLPSPCSGYQFTHHYSSHNCEHTI